MQRYIRAFWTALKMTLRGETVTPGPDTALRDWMAQTDRIVGDAIKTAMKHPQQVTLRIEGRDTTMKTILTGVRFHVTEEYPHLLNSPDPHSVTAILASNMNDHFQVIRLRDALEDAPELRGKLEILAQQLESIPGVQPDEN